MGVVSNVKQLAVENASVDFLRRRPWWLLCNPMNRLTYLIVICRSNNTLSSLGSY